MYIFCIMHVEKKWSPLVDEENLNSDGLETIPFFFSHKYQQYQQSPLTSNN